MFLITLFFFSDAGAEMLLMACFNLVLAAPLCIGTIITALVSLRGRHRKARALVIGGLVAILLCLPCWATDVAMRGRLWLSEAKMREYAENVPPGESIKAGSAGLYYFERVDKRRDGTVIFNKGYRFKDAYGFAYVPPGGSIPAGAEHVFGNWYKF
jgi:hypothetical protein